MAVNPPTVDKRVYHKEGRFATKKSDTGFSQLIWLDPNTVKDTRRKITRATERIIWTELSDFLGGGSLLLTISSKALTGLHDYRIRIFFPYGAFLRKNIGFQCCLQDFLIWRFL